MKNSSLKNKIDIIFTGGTIGSRLNEAGYIAPDTGDGYRLLELYEKTYGDEVCFQTSEPYRMLSENLDADYLMRLIHAVGDVLCERSSNGCEGIIVTHGTDTLQYSAAILSYVFADTPIPIILVSSNYILDDIRANGLVNLHTAVEFIRGKYGTGVFVSYWNNMNSINVDDRPTIHYGTRLLSAITLSDRVESIMDKSYGSFSKSQFVKNVKDDMTVGKDDENFALFGNCMTEGYRNVRLDPKAAVLLVQPSPGMCYPRLTAGVRAVLLGSYHSGTIAVSDDLREFMSEAKERKIPVYLVGLNPAENAYETVEQYRSLGIQTLPGSAVIAQYCKLWLLTSNGLDLDACMAKCYAHEHV